MARSNRFISSVTFQLGRIAGFFRKIRFDNFIGGLIIGAIFSLVVNVFTVQIQESVSRQRALEAIEREVAQHYLDTTLFYNEKDYFEGLASSGEGLYYPEVFYYRLNAKIWDSGEALKYIFELDPEVATDLSSYYERAVRISNNSFGRIQDEFEESFNIRCRPSNVLRDPDFRPDTDYCNALILETFAIYGSVYDDVSGVTDTVLQNFHPTQDRLDSIWLRFILGNKSIDVLQNVREDV